MKILHLDKNHEFLVKELKNIGHENLEAYNLAIDEIKSVIDQFDGIVVRSRFKIDSDLL